MILLEEKGLSGKEINRQFQPQPTSGNWEGISTVKMTTDEIMVLPENVMTGILIDSNIILDVFLDDPWADWSQSALKARARTLVY
ncbi:MAG: hypothetical protein R2875_07100 [Desulfobacterales bacterium]